MFRKPSKVKSNSQIKGSERKKFRAQLIQQFEALSSEDINELIPNKDEVTQMKIMTHNGHNITVYCIGQNPAFFIDEGIIYPTVYTMWKFPNLLPTLTTWPQVFNKLIQGADLMLPGVVSIPDDAEKLEMLKVGDVCALRLVGNKSAIAVGTSVISGTELKIDGRKGKAMILAHIYTDLLYSQGDGTKLPLVEEKFLENDHDDNNKEDLSVCDLQKSVEEVQLDDSPQEAEVKEEIDNSLSLCTEEQTVENTECENTIKASSDQMDDLLFKCFLTALKVLGKNIQLPILTSTFYKSSILACCPAESNLDIKKSSYKKLSNFLQEMKNRGIIDVQELSKGVESITDMNLQHPILKSFEVDPDFVISKPSTHETEEVYQVPEVKELYVVNASVLPFFKLMDYSKGSALTAAEIRKILTEYVKNNELQNPKNKREVNLDPILTQVMLSKGEDCLSLSWEDIHSRCLNKMQQAHEIIFPGKAPLFRKGKLNPIEVAVEQRTGNKKVTLIYYLEDYGIDAERFAHEIQLGVAASTKVSEMPGKKGLQVLIQGNQVKYVGKLLLDKYKMPKKYLKGFDNLSGGKKKK